MIQIKKKRMKMMIKLERNLYTVPTLFKKELKIIEKFK